MAPGPWSHRGTILSCKIAKYHAKTLPFKTVWSFREFHETSLCSLRTKNISHGAGVSATLDRCSISKMDAWIMFWFRTRVDPRRYSSFFQAWALDSLFDLLVNPAPKPESNGHVVFAHNVRCLQLFVDIISLNFKGIFFSLYRNSRQVSRLLFEIF